jgi:hypothetical protein
MRWFSPLLNVVHCVRMYAVDVGHEQIVAMSPLKRSYGGRRLLGVTNLCTFRTSSLRDARERLLFLLSGLGLVCVAFVAALSGGGGLSPPEVCAASAAVGFVPLASPTDQEHLVIRTYTGVMTSTYRITPKLPMGDVDPYAAVNFSQTVDDHQPGYTLVQVVTRSVLDSDAPFPLDEASLPDEARMELLPQPGWIQSDDGQVVALKDTLLQDVTSQTEAVTEILAWVRAHTQLVPTCPANDALSVLASGEATFDGFVTLSCALLRAAGIPARTVSGIVLPGQVMEWDWGERANLWHAWIEVYYPDLGWVPSDPQATINWIDSAHIHSGFTGVSTPTVERVSHVVRMSYLGDMTTEHVVTHDAWMLWAASTDGEAVSPLTTDLARLYRIHQDAPVREIQGYVANDRLCGDAWELRVEAPWLSIMPSSGQGVVDVTLRLDATELGVGRHGAQVSLVGLPDGGCQPPAPPLTHTFTVELDVRGRPRSHLPLVRR